MRSAELFMALKLASKKLDEKMNLTMPVVNSSYTSVRYVPRLCFAAIPALPCACA